MAHYNASVHTRQPPDEMFAYLSDFSSTQEWDPGVIEAERIGDAPVRSRVRGSAQDGRRRPLTRPLRSRRQGCVRVVPQVSTAESGPVAKTPHSFARRPDTTAFPPVARIESCG